jgi:hypothetical protein
MRGPTKAKFDRKGGLQRKKNEGKGPMKVKMKGRDTQKKFCSSNIKKVPRAYESLNPALG